MIMVDPCAEPTSGKPLPSDVLRLVTHESFKGKTCTVKEFPAENYKKYYLSSRLPAEEFLLKFPNLEVDCTVIISPTLLNHVPGIRPVLEKYHPEALL